MTYPLLYKTHLEAKFFQLFFEGDKLTLSECNIRASAEDGENGRGEIRYKRKGDVSINYKYKTQKIKTA